MNIGVSVRMSKIMRAPVKVVVPTCATYVTCRTLKYLKSDCGTTFEVLNIFIYFLFCLTRSVQGNFKIQFLRISNFNNFKYQ